MSLAVYLLCAGRGDRLRPLTERIAKPALTFLGKSALEINKFAIETLAPSRWLANTHHLPEQVGDLARRLGVDTVHEPEILGSGGCLANAAPMLGECETFLVHNADLIHTVDLADLYKRHQSSGALATLAGVFRPAHNTLSCAEGGRLLGVHGYREFDHRIEIARLTFAGIAFYERDFLRHVGAGPEDIKPYWIRALESGGLIHVEHCDDAQWHDFGTPQGLWDAAKFMMEATGEFNYNYHPLLSEPKPYVDNEAGQDDLPDLLRNVLVCEETPVPVPFGTKNCVLGRDFKWNIRP